MHRVRVFDPSRQPRDWMEIIQPGQYAMFASRLDDEWPCHEDGIPTSYGDATCVIVGSLAEAEAFARQRVEQHRDVRFDVFDAAGRSRPPLLTVVHPEHASRLEGNAGRRRSNMAAAVVLLVAAPILFWIDWRSGGALILPTVLAFNALLFAGRLLQLVAAASAAERQRLERVASQPGRSLPKRR